MLKTLYIIDDKDKNKKLVDVIDSGLSDFKKEIKNMSKKEKEAEKPYETVNIVKILEFNEQKQNQQGQGLKILTPNQMLSRLPIYLAELSSGNNSEKLKNEQINFFIFVQIKKTYKTNL